MQTETITIRVIPIAGAFIYDHDNGRIAVTINTNFGDAYIVERAVKAEEFEGVEFDSEGSAFYAYCDDRYVAEDVLTAAINKLDELGYKVDIDRF